MALNVIDVKGIDVRARPRDSEDRRLGMEVSVSFVDREGDELASDRRVVYSISALGSYVSELTHKYYHADYLNVGVEL